MPRKPNRGFGFIRQASGQIVYKFFSNEKRRWCARRLPKTVIYMRDAQDWVLGYVYGVKPETDFTGRRNKLAALIARTDNAGERAAAQQALNKMMAKERSNGER